MISSKAIIVMSEKKLVRTALATFYIAVKYCTVYQNCQKDCTMHNAHTNIAVNLTKHANIFCTVVGLE